MSGMAAAGGAAAGGGAGAGIAGVGSFMSNNASWLLPAALVGYQGLKGAQGLGNMPGYNQLKDQANYLQTQGTQMGQYLQNGTLPPGVQASLHQASESAKAAIKSQYAARGMSGSSAEAQDIAGVDNTIASQGANIATQLLNSGISESNLAGNIYSQILQQNIGADNQLGGALATLAGAAARPTINYQTYQA
jgi:hypothetical protein